MVSERGLKAGGEMASEGREDYAAPFRLRVDESVRQGVPLLVFTPVRLADEEGDGVLLVVGGELTIEGGWLRGIDELAVEEVDGVIEVTPRSRRVHGDRRLVRRQPRLLRRAPRPPAPGASGPAGGAGQGGAVGDGVGDRVHGGRAAASAGGLSRRCQLNWLQGRGGPRGCSVSDRCPVLV
ncbi:MAG: hypothetical protein JNL82_31035 [Myxococcales bacterium]|nr:hypothetical protein [Myxococcales bacterium]